MSSQGMKEKKGFSLNGYVAFVIMLLVLGYLVTDVIAAQVGFSTVAIFALVILSLPGFFMVQPNQAKVMTFFGSYVGTVKNNGLQWTIPFFIRKNISLRIRNFESNQMKVNDNHGNPIEIATVVVWSVDDTAEAVFEVEIGRASCRERVYAPV